MIGRSVRCFENFLLLSGVFFLLSAGSGRAQVRADSLKIPRRLYLQVERDLAVWDSVSRAPQAIFRESGFVTISRRRFEAIYPDIESNLLRFLTFRLKKLRDLSQTLRALVKIRYPDSTLSPCRFLRLPGDSYVTVSRAMWRKNLRQLAVLHGILTASSRDSTLLWETTEPPEISTNFWGRPFVKLSGKIRFLSPQRDTLYTLTLHQLKLPAKITRHFWQVCLTANWQILPIFDKRPLVQSLAFGISAAHYRRFFGEIFLGTKGLGLGVGWRIFENAGPLVGIQADFSGVWRPTAGLAFLLN